VGARVLRPHVDGHGLGAKFGAGGGHRNP
jgi:hypothetical protein